MKINCKLVSVNNPMDLDAKSLPCKRDEIIKRGKEIKHLAVFGKLLEEFNNNGDSLISEIFSPLFAEKEFEISVIATHGVPEPYDAWTAEFKGKQSFFLNMDLWTEEDLRKSGLAVIKHEAVHILLEELLQKPDKTKPTEILKRILIDEGIAHFIGCPFDRMTIFENYKNKREMAESNLKMAVEKLSNSRLGKKETEELLNKADSGKYWDKYASIAGMFRVAKIYSTKGAEGIIECIEKNVLPEQ